MVQAIVPGGRAIAVRRLKGGITMGMHAVRVEEPDGKRLSLVLRRYNEHWRARDPQGCVREWKTLEVLAKAGVSAPRPLWRDADGKIFGRSAMVMGLMPGRTTLAFKDRDRWIGDLAQALAALHRTDFSDFDLTFLPQSNRKIARMIKAGPKPAALARFPRAGLLWERLGALWPRRTRVAATLLHGDYWPGNTIWRRGRIAGITDWQEAGLGDPGEDVGYCRLDLALCLGGSAPDEFLEAYEQSAGQPVRDLQIWDMVAATRPLPDPADWIPGYHDLASGRTELTPRLLRRRLTGWIDRAIAQTT
jgi:aminoglycoside phosphotransferase (APT) family kinase protein